MRRLTTSAILVALSFGTSSIARWAAAAQTEKERGSVSGQAKVDGKPAKGIIIVAAPSVTDPAKIVESMFDKPTSLKATTDSDGRYKFDDVPSGRYRLVPFAPSFVNDSSESGNEVMVTGGSQTEAIDFSLSSGGVITGRVTDSDGRPVIGETISVNLADDSITSAHGPTSFIASMTTGSGRMYATDDQGIYRIFGLRSGRYLVSAGSDADVLSALFKFRPKRVQTFYPGVPDKARAKPVQVTAGAETTGIDIQFMLGDKGFDVSGRVIDADKGTPIANTMVAYSKARRVAADKADKDEADKDDDDDDWIGGFPGGFATTNEKGEFRFKSVAPGSYQVEVGSMGVLSGIATSEFYADPVAFEVDSANVDRLDVKVHRGASISGIVVAENADGQSGLESYGRLMLLASVGNEQTKSLSQGSCNIAPDGSFRIGGLKTGKAILRPFSMGEQPPILVRIERNGVEIQGGVEIQANEQISGLRIVIATANCVIRGHVTIQGGALPPGATLTAKARPIDGDSFDFFGYRSVDVDAKGDFVFEKLSPATYEVAVSAALPSDRGVQDFSARQTVTASRGNPVEVSLVLDLRAKRSDK